MQWNKWSVFISSLSEASDDQMLILAQQIHVKQGWQRDRCAAYETLQHPSKASVDPDVDPHT